MDAPPISQNKTVSKVNFSIIHPERTVCELTSSIIQTHYTQTTLFCLHLRKWFSTEDRRTLSPNTMNHVWWCRRILSGTDVWSVFVSLVSCILPPLRWFCATTYPVSCILPPLRWFCATTHHQWLRIQTRHIGRWLPSVKFLCKVSMQSQC